MTAAFPSLTQQYLYSAQWSEMDDLILYMTIILPLTLMFAVVEWTSALAAFLKIKRDESHGFSVFFYPFAPPPNVPPQTHQIFLLFLLYQCRYIYSKHFKSTLQPLHI